MGNDLTVPQQLQLDEWQEARKSVDRFDTILADLRKYGFTLVTGVLSADAFLTTVIPLHDFAIVVVFSAIILLVVALFLLDRYYQVLLWAAVSRAMDLEGSLEPPLGLTSFITYKATKAMADWLVVVLYALLIIGTLLLADAVAATAAAMESVGGVALGAIVLMLLYFLLTKPHVRPMFPSPIAGQIEKHLTELKPAERLRIENVLRSVLTNGDRGS
jgi:hypothetical protein